METLHQTTLLFYSVYLKSCNLWNDLHLTESELDVVHKRKESYLRSEPKYP